MEITYTPSTFCLFATEFPEQDFHVIGPWIPPYSKGESLEIALVKKITG